MRRILSAVVVVALFAGCAAGRQLSSDEEQWRNTVIGAAGGGACGVLIGTGVLTANPILLGAGAGACLGAALGASQPTREPTYPTIVYDPYRQPASLQRANLLVFLVSEEPVLRAQLSEELAKRGWRITGAYSPSSGPPSGAAVFIAKRVADQIQVQVFTWENWYAAATGRSVGEVVPRVLSQFGLN